jgi:hypothetical protein
MSGVEICRKRFDAAAMINRKAAAVSMEPELFERAKKRAKKLGFSTFSAYMTQLLRADLIRMGDLNIQEEAQPAPFPVRQETQYEPKKTTRKKTP